MSVKVYKPGTPGQRHRTGATFEEITKTKPEKSLLVSRSNKSGRNMYGRITVRHRGGGSKTKVRVVDFKRSKSGIPAVVSAIEYDPNRSARLALLTYADGEKKYIIAPLGLKVGDKIMSGSQAEIRPGNSLPIANIPVGTMIHNIELQEGKGGQMARSAGAAAQLLAKEGEYAHLRFLPEKSAWCGRNALLPSDRSVTLSTVRSILGAPGRNVIWASDHLCVAVQCPHGIIPMVAVKDVLPSVWQDLNLPGVNPLWVIVPGRTRRRINISFAADMLRRDNRAKD
jgi:hypothetical protein